jgi:hypothetical protein
MYEYILSTNARDEPAILEFIVHHLTVGFDFVFVIDHESLLPIQEEVDTLPARFRDRVRVIRLTDNDPVKIRWIKDHIVPFIRENASKYFIHLDADEYIRLGRGMASIRDVVGSLDHEPDVLVLHWRFFGSSGLDRNPHNLKHLMPVFTKCNARLDDHFKPLVSRKVFSDPGFCFMNPHYMKSPNRYSVLDGSVHYITNVGNHCSVFDATKDTRDPGEVQACIHHYSFQDREAFFFRKVHRKRDDDGKFRSGMDADKYMALHNEVDCSDLRDYYFEHVAPVFAGGPGK